MDWKEAIVIFFAVIGLTFTLNNTGFWEIPKALNQKAVTWIDPEANCKVPTKK